MSEAAYAKIAEGLRDAISMASEAPPLPRKEAVMSERDAGMIPTGDLKIETWPPRQRGGQHVGSYPDGVKITHLPSGTEAFVDIGRSQHINKMIAIDMIEAAVTHPRFR